ncbi:MAG TPA: DUF1302 family protein [Solimonas sp.]
MSGQYQRNRGGVKALVVAAGCMVGGAAQAGSFDLFGIDGSYQLLGTYSAAWRMEKPGDGIINTPPSPEIPIPDFLKLPESNNFDDGDRNFKRGSMVNNRVSLLGEIQLQYEDFGLLVRGDAFYDGVYYDTNDNRSLLTMNRTDGDPQFEPDTQVDAFSDIARYRSGRRARLLDAYVYGSWYLGESAALNVRLGRHIAAWGESLFMSGVALAQAPADATKATVPGADVKSILLPVNQLSMQLALNDRVTLLGQYKLEFKPVELNPVGEFFSVTDVVGPGAQFIWGIKNPLYFPTLADINLLSGQTPEALQLIADLVGVGAPLQGVTGLLQDALDRLDPLLPDVGLPLDVIPQPNTPRYINVVRGNDKKPSDHGQWGLGLKYQVTPETNLGLYRLRYHNTTPAPIQNYGFATLLPGQNGLPPLTTEALGLQVPVTYNVTYFDGVDLSALSFSTTFLGANVGGELLWREGIDVLVDVDGGLLGPVPTPTRANVGQALLSALYVVGPALFWDALTLVGEAGFVHVEDITPACGPTSCTTDLTYTRDASGWALLTLIDKKNISNGWDLQIPIYLSGIINGQSSVLSGLGSLMGEGDYRASIGFNFTWLQKLQLGASYNAFLGEPDFEKRPYADRDFAAVTVKYNF